MVKESNKVDLQGRGGAALLRLTGWRRSEQLAISLKFSL
jgi:hypothetical protein